MKKILLLGIILFLLVPTISMAQSSVEFAYDKSGNRIQRQVIVLGTKSATVATANNPEKDLYEWKEQEIKIYPNPTEGLLSVSISKLESLTEGTIAVTDLEGRVILTRRIESGLTAVDLSGQPSGYYLMRISVGSETSTWKIIKK